MRRCFPRSIRWTSGGREWRSSSRAAAESRICPPWPVARRRATRLTGAAEVVGVALLGVADVERHPRPERAGLRPRGSGERPLAGERRGERRGRGREGGAEGVADRLEDVAAVVRDRPAQQGIVPGDRGGHRPRQPLPELGAALDVGEEKGHRAAGQLGDPLAERIGSRREVGQGIGAAGRRGLVQGGLQLDERHGRDHEGAPVVAAGDDHPDHAPGGRIPNRGAAEPRRRRGPAHRRRVEPHQPVRDPMAGDRRPPGDLRRRPPAGRRPRRARSGGTSSASRSAGRHPGGGASIRRNTARSPPPVAWRGSQRATTARHGAAERRGKSSAISSTGGLAAAPAMPRARATTWAQVQTRPGAARNPTPAMASSPSRKRTRLASSG